MSLVPKAFAIVEPQVYRSSAFSREHFPFIRQLKLKTILFLSTEEAPKSLIDFCAEEEKVTLSCLASKQLSRHGQPGDWSPLKGELVKTALETVLDSAKLPLIIICLSGVHQTGALVGCLRKLQGWSFTSIIEEHRRFTEAISRSPVEYFIEMFDTDVVTLPKDLPDWFNEDLELLRSEEEEERQKIRTLQE